MKPLPLRGDIWWATSLPGSIGSEQIGRRPVVVVQNDLGNKHSSTFTVVPCTGEPKKNLPSQVMFMIFENGEKKVNTALCEQVVTISIDRLDRYVGRIDRWIMDRIDISIAMHLGLKEVPTWDCGVVEKPREVLMPIIQPVMTVAETARVETVAPLVPVVPEAPKAQVVQEPKKVGTAETSKKEVDEHLDKIKKKYDGIKRKYEKKAGPVNTYKVGNDGERIPVEKEGRTRHTWTKEKKKEFIKDKESMSISAVRKKYELGTDATVVSYYYKFKTDLGEE